jgi:hypothetical protein
MTGIGGRFEEILDTTARAFSRALSVGEIINIQNQLLKCAGGCGSVGILDEGTGLSPLRFYINSSSSSSAIQRR